MRWIAIVPWLIGALACGGEVAAEAELDAELEVEVTLGQHDPTPKTPSPGGCDGMKGTKPTCTDCFGFDGRWIQAKVGRFEAPYSFAQAVLVRVTTGQDRLEATTVLVDLEPWNEGRSTFELNWCITPLYSVELLFPENADQVRPLTPVFDN